MALLAFCPERAAAGVNEHDVCRHCQRQVDRYLDLESWQRLEADRTLLDFDSYADPDLADRPAAA